MHVLRGLIISQAIRLKAFGIFRVTHYKFKNKLTKKIFPSQYP